MSKDLDIAGMLAILYTLGYFGLVFMIIWQPLPQGNEATLNQLIGALTIIQTGIIGFYFGGSKANEQAQKTITESKAQSDTAMIEIAKAAPAPTTEPKVTPAPINTATGNIPAAETAQPKGTP